jgi:signal transduction histidine kinase
MSVSAITPKRWAKNDNFPMTSLRKWGEFWIYLVLGVGIFLDAVLLLSLRLYSIGSIAMFMSLAIFWLYYKHQTGYILFANDIYITLFTAICALALPLEFLTMKTIILPALPVLVGILLFYPPWTILLIHVSTYAILFIRAYFATGGNLNDKTTWLMGPVHIILNMLIFVFIAYGITLYLQKQDRGQRFLLHFLHGFQSKSGRGNTALNEFSRNLRKSGADPEVVKQGYNKMHRVLRDLEDSAKRAYGILQYEQGMYKPTITTFDINKLLEIEVDNFRPQYEEAEIELVFIPSTVDIIVESDAGKYREMVGDLLTNAYKHATPHDQPLKVVVEVQLGNNGMFITIVQDNGVGIKPELLEVLGTLYVKGDTSEGTGVGLAHISLTAKELGGSLGISSSPGKGARFSITLPVVLRRGKKWVN